MLEKIKEVGGWILGGLVIIFALLFGYERVKKEQAESSLGNAELKKDDAVTEAKVDALEEQKKAAEQALQEAKDNPQDLTELQKFFNKDKK